ncbi:MAG TPA: L-threonylcarbamoyladenylate synthase [Bacillales bacterium]|nr:L-threonylcarbamoyladenylate synthase [Bacillales bacterium]
MENRNTIRWIVDNDVHKLQLEEAAQCLRRNEVVAFPTETVYGLGGNALSDEAVGKIFAAKGRPADNPLIVHIADTGQMDSLVRSVPEKARKLIDRFWPGPLTIILPSGQAVANNVTAGLSTVAIRFPDHPVARALIEQTGLPIAAPSANRSGMPSPTSAAHVEQDLAGRIAGIVDGGETGIGVESTVVDCSGDEVAILRPGGVTRAEIEAVVGPVIVEKHEDDTANAPKSPGMKYRHYSPDAELRLVDGSQAFVQSLVDKEREKGTRVGVLTTDEHRMTYLADSVISCGSQSDLYTVAHGLYGALRAFDAQNIQVIYGEVFPETGVGEAIMNRLRKSAGGYIQYE